MKLSNNVKILIAALLIGLFWSMPALRAISTGTATFLEIWLSVLIRIGIVYAVLKFVVSMASGKKVKTKKA